MKEHKFTFGKYRGQKVSDIIKSNPKYVLWADNNVSYFTLSNEEKDELYNHLHYEEVSDRMESIMDREILNEMFWMGCNDAIFY